MVLFSVLPPLEAGLEEVFLILFFLAPNPFPFVNHSVLARACMAGKITHQKIKYQEYQD